jgi:hypothetical protein
VLNSAEIFCNSKNRNLTAKNAEIIRKERRDKTLLVKSLRSLRNPEEVTTKDSANSAVNSYFFFFRRKKPAPAATTTTPQIIAIVVPEPPFLPAASSSVA